MISYKFLIYLTFVLKFISIKTSYVLIDMIFKEITIQNPSCDYNRKIIINDYRGPIKNIDKIEANLNNNYKILTNNLTNSFLYFPTKEKLLKYINYIPDETLLFTNFEIEYTEIKRSICFIKLEEWSDFHYIIVSQDKLTYLTIPLIFCTFYINILIAVYKGYNESLKSLASFRKIYFYRFVRYTIIFCLGIAVSAVTIYYSLLSYILYSIYKSYVLMNLILLLEGFSTIHFNNNEKYFRKYILIIFSFDSLISLFSEYIIYFLPFLDNFYLFHLKSFAEHIVLLVIIFVFFHTKYIHMYKQYSIEKRLGTILSIGYRIKTVIYLKIMIFSIIYCSAFIILPFIEKIFIKIDGCVETFYVNYFITICLELVFHLVLVILLFPKNLTVYFFLPTIFDYNAFKFAYKIRQENQNSLNISNLTRNLLKDDYVEKQYPFIFITPFCATNKVFDNNIKVGLIGKST